MFQFGDPSLSAQIYWDNLGSIAGPKIVESPWEEMSESDLKNAMVYARIAYETAVADQASSDVLDLLLDQYDQIFAALCEYSDQFREFVLRGGHLYVGGHSPENIQKYQELAMTALES